MCILVVEDDDRLRDFLEIVVRRCGQPFRSVSSGEAALQALEEETFSVILLDLMLPVVSGFEILRTLRATQPHMLRRIIVLTAVSQSSLDREFDSQSLVWAIIRKPFDIEELTRAVDACARFHTARWPTRRQIAKWLAEQSQGGGAKAAVIAAVNDGRELHVVAAHGFPQRTLKKLFPMAVSAGCPLGAAVRTGRAVWLASLSGEDAHGLLPLWTASKSNAIAALPLRHNDVVAGVIGWCFASPQRFDHRQRAHLLETAAECVAMLPAARSGYLQIS